MSEIYDIIFSGELVPGSDIESVKIRVGALFGADGAQIERLFSGKKLVIKSGLSKDKAKIYLETLKGAGLIVQMESKQTAPESWPALSWDILPVGTALIEPSSPTTNNIDCSHLSMAEVASDLLAPNEKKKPDTFTIDIDHLQLNP